MSLTIIKYFLVIASTSQFCESLVRFTNIKCDTLDPVFCKFSKCYLKLMNRSAVALNVHVELYQLPVTNISINLSLHKKLNGYRPFLYNYSLDFCNFQRNPKKFPFSNIYFQSFIKDSNINHTCPYNHDIIVKDLVMKDNMLRSIPLPKGEYMILLNVAAYNDWKATVKAYVNVDLGFRD